MSFYSESRLMKYTKSFNLTDSISKKISAAISKQTPNKRPVAREADSKAMLSYLDEVYGDLMDEFCTGDGGPELSREAAATAERINPILKKLRNAVKVLDSIILRKLNNISDNQVAEAGSEEVADVQEEQDDEGNFDTTTEETNESKETNESEETNGSNEDQECFVIVENDESSNSEEYD